MSSTMKDISKYTGLGLATVSSYFNGGNLRQKNQLLIEKAIVDLNFELNETARSLRTKKSKTIGIVIPELNNIFCTTIISEVEDILRASGYASIVCDCRSNVKLERELIDFLLKKKVDGIINMPVCRNGENLQRCIDKNIPIVLIDRKLDEVNADCVIVDNLEATYEATKLLIDNGHRKIGFVGGESGVFTADQRLLGYISCLSDNNISVDSGLIVHGNYTVEGGIFCIKELLDSNRDMTAVLVSNFEMTLGTLISINEINLKIPQDLSIIGFDNLELAKLTTPNLYIVAQPLDDIAKRTAKLLLDRLNNPDKSEATTKTYDTVTLKTRLIAGKSIKNLNI